MNRNWIKIIMLKVNEKRITCTCIFSERIQRPLCTALLCQRSHWKCCIVAMSYEQCDTQLFGKPTVGRKTLVTHIKRLTATSAHNTGPKRGEGMCLSEHMVASRVFFTVCRWALERCWFCSDEMDRRPCGWNDHELLIIHVWKTGTSLGLVTRRHWKTK